MSWCARVREGVRGGVSSGVHLREDLEDGTEGTAGSKPVRHRLVKHEWGVPTYIPAYVAYISII